MYKFLGNIEVNYEIMWLLKFKEILLYKINSNNIIRKKKVKIIVWIFLKFIGKYYIYRKVKKKYVRNWKILNILECKFN